MSQVIIWKQENGVIAVATVSDTALLYYTMDQVAKMIVPTGVGYKIVDRDFVPEDIDNWYLPDEFFDDGVGEA